MTPLRYLDVFLVLITAPVVVLAGAPALGILLAAGVWVAQRSASAAMDAYGQRQDDPRTAASLNFAGAIARPWIIALLLLVIGVTAGKRDGIAAAFLTLAAFTVYLITTVALHQLERASSTAERGSTPS